MAVRVWGFGREASARTTTKTPHASGRSENLCVYAIDPCDFKAALKMPDFTAVVEWPIVEVLAREFGVPGPWWWMERMGGEHFDPVTAPQPTVEKLR